MWHTDIHYRHTDVQEWIYSSQNRIRVGPTNIQLAHKMAPWNVTNIPQNVESISRHVMNAPRNVGNIWRHVENISCHVRNAPRNVRNISQHDCPTTCSNAPWNIRNISRHSRNALPHVRYAPRNLRNDITNFYISTFRFQEFMKISKLVILHPDFPYENLKITWNQW